MKKSMQLDESHRYIAVWKKLDIKEDLGSVLALHIYNSQKQANKSMTTEVSMAVRNK